MKLQMQQGEHGMAFELTLHDHDGGVHALAGSETIKAYVTKPGSDPASFGTGAVHDAENGVVRITVGSGDDTTLVQGTYEIRVKISGASSVLIPEPETLEVGRGVS